MANATNEQTQFGSLASRITNCSERVSAVASQVKICVDTLNGPEPQEKASGVGEPEKDGAILITLSNLLSQLECQLVNLEGEQSRLSKLF